MRRESALVALAGLAFYAILCPPVSGMGDSSEFALVLATNGVAHPTGYPLYTLLGHGFVTLLHGLGISWTYAAGLWSAVGGAVALYFLHALATDAIAMRAVPPATRRLAAGIPLALFAFHPAVLGEATAAEINIWSLAWACGAAFAFLSLAGRLAGVTSERDARRGAAAWGVVCGLGLAHHLTSILFSAPLTAGLIAMQIRRRRFSAALPAIALVAALLPLSSYALIAWRAWHPASIQWAWLEPSLASVMSHITGAQYRLFVGSFDPSAWQRELLNSAVFPFLFTGIALLLFDLWRARDTLARVVWITWLAAVALVSLFTFGYGVPDPAPYFLPAMALAVPAAASALTAIPRIGGRAGTTALTAAGFLALALVVPWLRDANEERLATLSYDRVIHSMWSSIPPDTAVVSWTDDRFSRLVEYQRLRGEKPALVVVTPDLLFAPRIRQAFAQRFGVDPIEGFQPPRLSSRLSLAEQKSIIDDSRQRLVQSLNERLRVPVIVFDPSVPTVWQLDKPGEKRRP